MWFARTRTYEPMHAATASTDADARGPERPRRARPRRRSHAPLVIFALYAIVIGVNEWRLHHHVASAEPTGAVPIEHIED